MARILVRYQPPDLPLKWKNYLGDEDDWVPKRHHGSGSSGYTHFDRVDQFGMPVLETPSRVWRRIQAADDLAVPSLPSLPAIDFDDDDEDIDEDPLPSRRSQSTPSAPLSVKKSTTVRFAEKHESFEFSNIQPIHPDSILSDEDSSKLPPEYSVDISAHFTVSLFAHLI